MGILKEFFEGLEARKKRFKKERSEENTKQYRVIKSNCDKVVEIEVFGNNPEELERRKEVLKRAYYKLEEVISFEYVDNIAKITFSTHEHAEAVLKEWEKVEQ